MKQSSLYKFGAFFSAIALLAGSASAQKEETLDSIKYLERPDGSGELLTGISTFTNENGQQVDLVGVIHIGDEGYYNKMNSVLGQYDVVLYEMVGGPVEERDSSESSELQVVQMIQRLVQSLLGLRYQLDVIDYSPDHFVHADATWKQWEELNEARNESLLTLFAKAMAAQREMETSLEDINPEQLMTQLGESIMEFNPEKFKRSVGPLLAEAESLVQALEGPRGSVIIGERNKIVMKALAEQIEAGHQKIGVFYGAGHNPDFAQRLAAEGYTRGDTKWMTAWDISNSNDPLSGMEVVENLLKDDYVVEGIFQLLRGLMEE
ncbi:MAG: hypothetical protein ACI8UO_002759 [Verrucomicrobiales bacterium]|jgi:hypothetical protein